VDFLLPEWLLAVSGFAFNRSWSMHILEMKDDVEVSLAM